MSRFRMPRAFGHPLFFGALALLVLNDHVLKGSGILPGALTGKLSDFAGMLVAPPLLALALGCGAASSRAAATIAVGVVFAAIKLSPQAAHALEEVLHACHLRARIWVDPSDLLALIVLPLGHALARPRAVSGPLTAPARAWFERCAIAAAACACLASIGGGDDDDGSDRGGGPEIENASDQDIRVIVASTEGAGGCRIYRDDRIALLTADAFVAPREIVLKPKQRAPLTVQTSGDIACGAASIQLADGDGLHVFWRELPEIEELADENDERRAGRRIAISGQAHSYDFEVGEDLTAFTLGGPLPEANCPTEAPMYSLEWSALPAANGFLELGEVRTAEDGCLSIDWFKLGGGTSPLTQRLCVPAWAFPFTAGDELAVVQALESEGSRLLRVTRTGEDGVTELRLWSAASEFEDSRATELTAIDCVGDIVDCGAYVRPAQVALRGREEPLLPGQEASFDDGRVRVLLGPARDVAWSTASCTGVEARIGLAADLLELHTP
jgi:hypothetical protein